MTDEFELDDAALEAAAGGVMINAWQPTSQPIQTNSTITFSTGPR